MQYLNPGCSPPQRQIVTYPDVVTWLSILASNSLDYTFVLSNNYSSVTDPAVPAPHLPCSAVVLPASRQLRHIHLLRLVSTVELLQIRHCLVSVYSQKTTTTALVVHLHYLSSSNKHLNYYLCPVRCLCALGHIYSHNKNRTNSEI